MDENASDLTAAERAALDYFGEELALTIEGLFPRLDVRAIDLEIGIKLATARTLSAGNPGTRQGQSRSGGARVRQVEADRSDHAPRGAGGREAA